MLGRTYFKCSVLRTKGKSNIAYSVHWISHIEKDCYRACIVALTVAATGVLASTGSLALFLFAARIISDLKGALSSDQQQGPLANAIQ